MNPTCSIEPLEARIAPAASAVFHLADLNGLNGFKLTGVGPSDCAGGSVSGAGDVNGDGYDDFIVGAEYASEGGVDRGAAYVVFGRADGFPAGLALSALDGSNGFKLSGADDLDLVGNAVSGAGDVNGDGFDDVIVGAFRSALHGVSSGAAYVIFGKANGFAATLSLGALDGSNGFQLIGVGNHDTAGASVHAAGDVNGDGFADVIIGAYRGSGDNPGSGTAYVVFGKAGGFGANLELSALDGSNGFKLSGTGNGDYAGYSVSGAGDVNGDGFADVIIGAPKALSGTTTPNGPYYAGATYVVFGKANGFAADLSLATLDGSNGFKLEGVGTGEEGTDYTGASVSGAGDVNGDGFADLIIGASEAYVGEYGAFRGVSYVVFGKAGGFGASLALAALDGGNGFKLNGAADYDHSGFSVSGAGDVNGDGFADLLVGAPYVAAHGTERGAAYVVYGKASGFHASVALAKLNGRDGFKLAGVVDGDTAGRAVSGAGDFNGDGFADLLVGAPHANGSNVGGAYIVYGFDSRINIDPGGTVAHFSDADGDVVTISASKGHFVPQDFRVVGGQVSLHLPYGAGFRNADITFTAATPPGGSGDGLVHVGTIDATGLPLGKVTVAGSLSTLDAAALHKVTVTGDLDGDGLRIGGKLGKVVIGGDLVGRDTAHPAAISALDGIGNVTVKGSVSQALILAGYDPALTPQNADASIGKIMVFGDWTVSSVAAGIADSTHDGFGQNDTLIPGGSATVLATIASITIKGSATGSLIGGDFFGLTAELIKKAKISGLAYLLTSGKDESFIEDLNDDFKLIEL